jgi:hypothetical protein
MQSGGRSGRQGLAGLGLSVNQYRAARQHAVRLLKNAQHQIGGELWAEVGDGVK